jgi:cobalt-precorrin-7 (C5)-methyltransferase
MHEIIVAGIGPGHPDYMLPAAAKAIAGAGVLVGGRRALAQFAKGAGQKTMAITRDIAAVMDFIRQEAETEDVVVMVSGDPGYYSLLDALRRYFPSEQLRVIPGLSAMQLAFARLALPWHEAKLLSFHGRVPAAKDLQYEQGSIVGMLTDAKYTSKTIPAVLMAHGWPKETRLFICARLSYADEKIVRTTLAEAEVLPETAGGILIAMDEEDYDAAGNR